MNKKLLCSLDVATTKCATIMAHTTDLRIKIKVNVQAILGKISRTLGRFHPKRKKVRKTIGDVAKNAAGSALFFVIYAILRWVVGQF